MRGALDAIRFAGASAALCAAIGVVVGAVAILVEARLPDRSSNAGRSNRLVAGGLAVLIAAGMVGFVVAVGDPVDWMSSASMRFAPAEADPRARGVRGSASTRARIASTSGVWRSTLRPRSRYWATVVAAISTPTCRSVSSLTGRRAMPTAWSSRSLAELGIVGLVLLLTAIAAAAWAVLRARKLEPSAAGLGAIALASGTYWLVHSSVDWFWAYPAVTAPAIMLAGAASAPGLVVLEDGRKRGWRPWLLVGLSLLAVSAVPPFLSERYVNDAYENWRVEPDRAYADLDRASDLNRLSDAPLLAEAAIAMAGGDRARALAALGEATELRPEEYAGHYLLAELQAKQNPDLARDEILIALELNPLDEQVQTLARDLGLDPEDWPAPAQSP